MIREGLKLPGDVKQKMPEMIELVSQDNDVIALYAFGSLAINALKPLSDLDFGILLSSRLSKQQRFDKHLELIGTFNNIFQTDEIDLILMNDAPLKLSFNIIKSGKVLFCRKKSDLIDYHDRLTKQYLDFKFFRDNFDAVFLKGLGYHG